MVQCEPGTGLGRAPLEIVCREGQREKMFRHSISQQIFVLLCLVFLCMPALREHTLAQARTYPHARKIPHQETPNPIMSASIQAPNNIWYTGIGSTANNYVLIQYWNGTTFRTPAGIPANSYAPSDAGQAVLSLSPTDNWVIANGHTDENPLQIFHFNGITRQIFPSPPVKGAIVNAMAAVNAHDIWAVGSAGPQLHNFTMHWDGTSWQAIDAPAPLPPEDTNILRGVTARSANDVWAVGTQQDPDGGDSPFALHWDGTRWSIKSPPDTDDPHGTRGFGRNDAALIGPMAAYTVSGKESPDARDLVAAYYRAVAAVSTTDVWVVGSGGIIDHWDGSRWRTFVAPIRSDQLSLSAISAYSSHDIWAVGRKTVCSILGECNPVTFTEHWNGRTWRIVPSPSLSFPNGSSIGALVAVKMFAPHNVWALGTTTGYVFLEHWDGQSWRVTAQHNLFA